MLRHLDKQAAFHKCQQRLFVLTLLQTACAQGMCHSPAQAGACSLLQALMLVLP